MFTLGASCPARGLSTFSRSTCLTLSGFVSDVMRLMACCFIAVILEISIVVCGSRRLSMLIYLEIVGGLFVGFPPVDPDFAIGRPMLMREFLLVWLGVCIMPVSGFQMAASI